MQPEKAVVAAGAFSDHFAMLVLRETVDHHPVEAGHLADDPRTRIDLLVQRIGLYELRDEPPPQVFVFPDGGRPLLGMEELQDDVVVVPVRQAFELDEGAVGRGEAEEPGLQQLRHRGLQRKPRKLRRVLLADQPGDGPAEDLRRRRTHEIGGVGAGEIDDEAVGLQSDQGAMRLHPPDQVDRLAVAGVEVHRIHHMPLSPAGLHPGQSGHAGLTAECMWR